MKSFMIHFAHDSCISLNPPIQILNPHPHWSRLWVKPCHANGEAVKLWMTTCFHIWLLRISLEAPFQKPMFAAEIQLCSVVLTLSNTLLAKNRIWFNLPHLASSCGLGESCHQPQEIVGIFGDQFVTQTLLEIPIPLPYISCIFAFL